MLEYSLSPAVLTGVIPVEACHMTDHDLLQQFLATRDEKAFAELVRRHIGLVYAAARRQIKDAETAEDVTQSVFILLAQKARTLRRAGGIGGWLLITTRCVALNTIRAQIRRARHESEAAVMKKESQTPVEPRWDSIGPLLDEAVASLRADDRDALTLRYFQNQPLLDVANTLGISEPAARKRVQRAVEKLRRFFATRGIVTSAEALGAMLPVQVLAPVPTAALCDQIAHTAVATTQTIAGGSLAGALKGAVLLMTATKTNIAIACIVAVLAVGVSGTVAYFAAQGEQSAAPAAPAPQRAENWKDRFNRTYALRPGEAIKHIAAPFPPERDEYCREEKLDGVEQGMTRPPDMIVFEADGGSLQRLGFVYGARTLGGVLSPVAHLLPSQTNLPPEMLNAPVSGDWIVRKGATQAELVDGFATQLASILGPGMTLKPVQAEREAIIVRGSFKPIPPINPTNPEIRFTRDITEASNGYGSRGKVSEMATSLGEALKLPIVLEAQNTGQLVVWTIEPSADYRSFPNPPDSATVDAILATVAKQTSLELKREKRMITIWQLEVK